MIKKLLALAVITAFAAVPAVSQAQGQYIQSSAVKASTSIQALCKNVSLGNLAFGPIVPNGTNTNGGYYFAATNLQNDCVSGTTYNVATFDSCNLSDGSGDLIPYDIILNSGPSVNNCSAPSSTIPAHSLQFTAGGNSGTNNIQLVGVVNASNVNPSLPSGTYSDSVVAVVYF